MDLFEHLATMKMMTNQQLCKVCGNGTLMKCNICNRKMCVTNKRKWNGLQYAFHFHSKEFFGLSWSDYKLVNNKKTKGWKALDKKQIDRNAKQIHKMIKNIENEWEKK